MPAQRMFPSPVPLKDACTYAALTALHKICRKILHLIESLRPATLPRNLRVQAAPATFSRTHTEWWGGPFISKVKKKGMEWTKVRSEPSHQRWDLKIWGSILWAQWGQVPATKTNT